MNQRLLIVLTLVLFSQYLFSQSYNNEWIDYNKTYYKFKVFGFGTDAAGAPIPKGMVRISHSSLQSAGLAGVAGAHFQLWRDGQEVPVYVSNTGIFSSSDYIEFWGEINNGKLDAQLYGQPDFQLSDKWSLQTDTASYFLTVNTTAANKRLTPTANNVANTSLTPTTYFMHTVGRYFRAGDIQSGFYASSGTNLFSSTYDKGEGWLSRVIRPVACGSSTTLGQGFPDLYPFLSGPSSMVMRINAVGGAQNSRVVRVLLNGQEVNLFQMDYINYEKVEELVPVSTISSGSASFSIINQSPSPCDEMRVAKIELTYPRQFNFGGSSVFEFSVPASSSGRLLKIANFNHGGVAPVLYDQANGKRYVTDISDPNIVQVVLAPATVAYQLVLTTQAGNYFKEISSFQQRSFINYAQPANQGDYLIVSNPLIYGSGSENYVEQYRQYRSSTTGGGYNAKVIDIEQLVDQFAYGVKKHPLSIKNFLRFARANFAAAPKHVFLIGKGVSYNHYRQYENNAMIERLNLVPTWGFPASDNLLASSDMKAVPATPIGRLSAVSPQEVGDYLEKVKQYEAAQAVGNQTLQDKHWMKNILQIAGANDITLGSQIDGYLNGYKATISDTSFGGNVTNFSKTADPANYTNAIISFKEKFEKGASLITYFGHSSSSNLDFNLDNPESYNNSGKYPVFIANGCSAGNHFAFETSRFTTKTTISEKFVLAPSKGAIGYLASTHFGVVNYLDLFSKHFYKSIAQTSYAKTAGEIIKEAIGNALTVTGPMDYYARVHAETYAWHGDPAVKFNSFKQPDYVIEAPQISTSPAFHSVADTSLFVKVRVFNIGKATNDSVSFKLTRTWPGGNTKTIATKKFAKLHYADSITVEVPVVGNIDAGVNVFTATINDGNTVAELSTANNSAAKSITISANEIRPIYPYNYSIINQPNAKLVASTANPLEGVRNYVMEIDTTALFNSPAKVSATKASAGGVVEFDPGFSYENDRTYYWRVSPAGLTTPEWRQFSFVYKTGLEGAQQGHLYQLLQSKHKNISLDSASRKYGYQSQNHNLFISNAMYPTSGTEDMHFSISVDGVASIRSACIGSSIIVNVFDSLTFRPWRNTTNPFGAAPVCNPGREYNFEYSYRTAASRKNAMDFLNSIPSGAFVTVRLINDAPYNIYASHWQADTSLYGSGNSLYHMLKSQGFAEIDSFYFPRTWAFVYQKNNPAFEPVYEFSEGQYDKLVLSKDATSPHVSGVIESPRFGPATSWNKVQWAGTMEEAGNDYPAVQVVGTTPAGQEVVLHTLNVNQQDFDISGISAAAYPFIKLRMENADTVTATPYQLSMWRVLYTPVREGAIAPNLYYHIPDTVGFGTATAFTLPLQVGFKNVSNKAFDSVAVKIVLTDTLNNTFDYQISKLKPLAPGELGQVNVSLNVQNLSGWYNVYIEANPGLQQSEQFGFNNFLYKKVYVNTEALLPVTLLAFDAQLQGADVKTSWSVTAENKVAHYIVQHSSDGTTFAPIGKVNAVNVLNGNRSYEFVHANAPAGKNLYRLQMVDSDGSHKYSATRLVTIGKNIQVSMYPNPVKDILNISINNNGNSLIQLRMVNTYGQTLWVHKAAGITRLDMTSWPAGMYMLIVDDGKSIQSFKVQKQ
ncbi:C25 family cysteine peptidase [Aridibaculum aurantiacum]|uniref:putative type IX secretion system sortase PorU2 n=1 Tax=Aridibaculum aurantiacum TaxID=2810307 RepID=UPI001A972371|nr:C25 family cysteine peptidase [Aridibaculum aurantiacum]